MIDAATLISRLREQGIKIWVEQDQLKCSAPKGALEPELRQSLYGLKQELLVLFRRMESLQNGPKAIVRTKPDGSKPPLFVVSGFGADPYYFVALARQLDPDQPLINVQPPGLDGGEPCRSVESLARFQIEQIRRCRPLGPYMIAGHCSGGAVAFEVARQLTKAGQEVAFVALIGSPFPSLFKAGPQVLLRLAAHLRGLLTGSLDEKRAYVKTKLQNRAARAKASAASKRVDRAALEAVRNYKPQPYDGCLDLFVTSDEWRQSHPWRSLAKEVREHDFTAFKRDELLLGPHVSALAVALTRQLRTLDRQV